MLLDYTLQNNHFCAWTWFNKWTWLGLTLTSNINSKVYKKNGASAIGMILVVVQFRTGP